VVDAEVNAQICEFVRKRYLGGEERVRGVLDRLRRLDVRREERTFRGPVEAFQDPGGLRSVGPEDDPIRSQGVLEGPSFAKEFGVHPESERHVRGFEDRADEAVHGPRQDGALDDHGTSLAILPSLGEGFHGLAEGAVVHAAVRSGRRPNAEEYDGRRTNRLLHPLHDREPLLTQDLLQRGLDSFFVEGRLAAGDLFAPLRVDVHRTDSGAFLRASRSPYRTTRPHPTSRTMSAASVPSETRTGFANIIASNSLLGAANRLFGTLGSYKAATT